MKFVLLLLGLLPASWAAAQTAHAPPVSEPIPTPVELMTGHNYLLLQSLIVKDLMLRTPCVSLLETGSGSRYKCSFQ